MLQTVQKQQLFADLKEQLWTEAESHLTGRLDLDMAMLQTATSGGLALGRVHLVSGGPQDGAATGFATAILRKLLQQNPDQALVWCLPAMPRTGMPFADGLAALGLDPARIIFVCESHPLRAIAASEEALAADGVAAVMCEYGPLAEKSDLWLKAARRLQLAAEAGRTTGIMLGPPAIAAGFETAWHIMPAQNPSTKTAQASLASKEMQFDWQPCWQADLKHCRGGRPATVTLYWDINTGRFRTASSKRITPIFETSSYQAKHPAGLLPYLKQAG